MRFAGPWGIFAGAAPALVLALMGCGNSGGGDATAEQVPRTSKAALLRKGAAICDHGNELMGAELDRFAKRDLARGRVATRHELNERAARVVLPVRKMELRRLRALGLPKEGAGRFQTMLAAMEEGIEKGERDHYLLLAKKAIYAFREASEVGIRLGLSSCWLQ